MTVLMFFIFAVIVLAFSVFLLVVFYHVGKFSFVGDISKRVFVIFTAVDCLIIIVAFIMMVFNHLLK